jgi:hypothetical protein
MTADPILSLTKRFTQQKKEPCCENRKLVPRKEKLLAGLDGSISLVKVPFMNKAQQRFTQRAVGLLLMALILVMGMAGVSPDLHRALHQGVDCAGECQSHPTEGPEENGHICGVTLLQTGALLQIALPAPETLGTVREVLQSVDETPVSAPHLWLPRGRAPPIAGIV